MIRIHTRNGNTTRVDMSDSKQAEWWINQLKDPVFQSNITGITVGRQCNGKLRCTSCSRKLYCPNCGSNEHVECNVGVQFSLSRPVGFKQVKYFFEHVEPDPSKKLKGGERVLCLAGNTKINMMVHANQLASRTILSNVGRQTFDPVLDR
jgi:hypothetical protein